MKRKEKKRKGKKGGRKGNKFGQMISTNDVRARKGWEEKVPKKGKKRRDNYNKNLISSPN